MQTTINALLSTLDVLGYPSAADTLRDDLTPASVAAVAADIADSAQHGATPAEIERALRVVHAVASLAA